MRPDPSLSIQVDFGPFGHFFTFFVLKWEFSLLRVINCDGAGLVVVVALIGKF